jgi:hypothetical protein
LLRTALLVATSVAVLAVPTMVGAQTTLSANSTPSQNSTLTCPGVRWYTVNFPEIGGYSNFQRSQQPIGKSDDQGDNVSQTPSAAGIALLAKNAGAGGKNYEVSSAIVLKAVRLSYFSQNGGKLDIDAGKAPLAVNVWIDTNHDGQSFQWDGHGILTGLGGDDYGAYDYQTGMDVRQITGTTKFQLYTGGGSITTLDQLAQKVGSDTKVWFWIGVDTEAAGEAQNTITKINGNQVCSVVTPPTPVTTPPAPSPSPTPVAGAGGTGGAQVPGLPNTGVRPS